MKSFDRSLSKVNKYYRMIILMYLPIKISDFHSGIVKLNMSVKGGKKENTKIESRRES